jgi:hypothetical protein
MLRFPTGGLELLAPLPRPRWYRGLTQISAQFVWEICS